MIPAIFHGAGYTPANQIALQRLAEQFPVAGKPEADVTHLLLPVPSFEPDGRIRGGGVLEHILPDLPENITVIGGNLQHPALHGYKTIDLLRDEEYVAQNAAITADCAVRVIGSHLPTVFEGCPVLIVGWGRIGKCLAAKLRSLGAEVTVMTRKEETRCMLRALGFGSMDPAQPGDLGRFRVIVNTAPVMVLSKAPKSAVKIDLASRPGIGGSDVIKAGGLPGKMAPEASGALIARTVIRLIQDKEGV